MSAGFGRESRETHWTVARVEERCGADFCVIKPGAPMQVLSTVVIQKRRVRCLEHAIGAADWDAINAEREQFEIEETERAQREHDDASRPKTRLVSRTRRTSGRAQSFSSLADIGSTFDPKSAAANDR